MILVASGVSDIVTEYPEWLFKRIYNGKVVFLSNNDKEKIVSFNPENVSCIVFRTRKPEAIINQASSISSLGYKCIYEVFLSPYKNDLEPNLGNKREILKSIVALSEKVSSECVVWHYSPLLITNKYTVEFHKKAFLSLCKALQGTYRFVQIDFYKNNYNSPEYIREASSKEKAELSHFFIKVALKYGLNINCNFNDVFKKPYDIEEWEKIIGKDLKNEEIIELGKKGSCGLFCLYCPERDYICANQSKSLHNPNSLALFGQSKTEDSKIKKRKVNSVKNVNQQSFFSVDI